MTAPKEDISETLLRLEKTVWHDEYARMARALEEIAWATRARPCADPLLAGRLLRLAAEMADDLLRLSSHTARLSGEDQPPCADDPPDKDPAVNGR
jgi:hypothetical protein